jgi:hypothetical protein
MPPHTEESWFDLFTAENDRGPVVSLDMRAVRRHGQPFLLLPAAPALAARSLSLYPAQSRRARTARKLLAWLLLTRCPWGLEKLALKILPDDSFIGFLTKLAGLPRARCPAFAVLAGNPATQGRRFVILVFDAEEKPVAVVKAGLGISARQLIEKEAAFLASIPPNTIGVPKMRDSFQSSKISALALAFFDGDSPRAQVQQHLAPLLNSWLDDQRTIPLAKIPSWQRLEKACGSNPLFLNLAKTLSAQSLHPTIYHGDLSPWNMKVSTEGKHWTVLDWERGELSGIPGWDWFHYVIQTGILVGHLSTAVLAQKIKTLLGSPDFQRYAERAAIIGCESQLFLAYLLYHIEVLQPSEGLPAARDLLSALATEWLKD